MEAASKTYCNDEAHMSCSLNTLHRLPATCFFKTNQYNIVRKVMNYILYYSLQNYICGHIYQEFIITHYYIVYCHLIIHD
jgi:hypothetical protein